VNLDLVARCRALPRPGETVEGLSFARVPGGKGANQALAAARLGADVRLVGCVGADGLGEEALALLVEGDLVLDVLTADTSTGVALIVVDEHGETQITIVPGANAALGPDDLDLDPAEALLCQLEVPGSTVRAAAARVGGFFCLNAAPARPVPDDLLARADLVVVNRLEHEAIEGRAGGLVAVTRGAEGAVLLRGGKEVARATPPAVHAIDGTAAGDAFCAALAVSLLEERAEEEALRRACAAGALAASRFGAQPSLPTAAEVDAIMAG
jgi:ribokinase